jgi:hypothetical protein
VSDRRDASQRFLVSAFRRVARQRQIQHEFDWRALFKEKPNNLLSCHYYYKNIFYMFPAWVSLIYFQFFPVYSFSLLHFILFIAALYWLYFFHFHDRFILHFTPPLYTPFDRHKMFCNTSNGILTLSTLYFSAANTAMGQESKI